MKKDTLIRMTTGSPAKLILRFTWPLLLGNLMQQLYNIVDSIVVGQFVGHTALAAVGTTFPVVFLMISLFIGLGTGATVIISQYYGAEDQKNVKRTIDTIYLTMLGVAIPLTAIGILLARPLLILIDTPADVLPQATTYMQIIFAGLIASFGFNVNNGILQGLGDSRSPLLFLGIATVLNIILDLFFVLVFNWGVMGVALATIIAQLVAFGFSIWHINRNQEFIRISPRGLNPSRRILWKSVRIGLPTGLQNVSFSLGTMVLQRLINGYQSEFMAGFIAANRIDTLSFLPMMSFSIAITTFVGQNIGAGQIERARKGVRSAVLLSTIVCLVICPIILIFARPLLMMFNDDPLVIESGLAYLNRVIPFFVLLSLLFILSGALRGAGETMIPLFSSVGSLWIARLPVAYLLAHYAGRDSLFFSFPIGFAIGLAIVVPYYLSGRWLKKSLVEQKNDFHEGGSADALL